jgi:hypothetical protein
VADACGKGYIAKQIQAHLGWRGVASPLINVDSWLNLPDKRFAANAPSEHFYPSAIRFDELFADLVLPLRDERSIYPGFQAPRGNTCIGFTLPRISGYAARAFASNGPKRW